MSEFRFLIALSLAACVGYRTDDADARSVAAELCARAGGTFTWSNAIAIAFRQNPELLALEAEARAAGAAIPATDLEGEYRGDTGRLALLVDPIAMLGLGARGAAADLAASQAAAAAERLALARWRTFAAIVETFAIDETLTALPAPAIDVDARPFANAGLATPAAAARLQAAAARLAAERATRDAEREANRARLRELLGLPATAEVTFATDGELPIAQPGGTDAILGRPDLAVATAEFRVADAEFRRAVADQYPSLQLGPDIGLRGGMLDVMAVVRLPIGASGPAAAAGERRDAARARLSAACVRADNEAAAAERALDAARANDEAAAAGLQASLRSLTAGKVAAQVDDDGFERLADAAAMVARDAMERREAAVSRVRAEITRAAAFGWPTVRRSS